MQAMSVHDASAPCRTTSIPRVTIYNVLQGIKGNFPAEKMRLPEAGSSFNSGPDLVGRIILRMQVPGAARRRAIERELRDHIEDMTQSLLDAGHTEAEIEDIVIGRFGDPDQIAGEFSRTYRAERLTADLVRFGRFLFLSMLVTTALVCLAWLATAFANAIPITAAFPLRGLRLLLCSLLCIGYVATYLGARLLRAGQHLQCLMFSAGSLALAAVVLYILGSELRSGIAVLVLGALLSLLRDAQVRLAWIAAIGIPLLLVWSIFGPFVRNHDLLLNSQLLLHWQTRVFLSVCGAIFCWTLHFLTKRFELRTGKIFLI